MEPTLSPRHRCGFFVGRGKNGGNAEESDVAFQNLGVSRKETTEWSSAGMSIRPAGDARADSRNNENASQLKPLRQIQNEQFFVFLFSFGTAGHAAIFIQHVVASNHFVLMRYIYVCSAHVLN